MASVLGDGLTACCPGAPGPRDAFSNGNTPTLRPTAPEDPVAFLLFSDLHIPYAHGPSLKPSLGDVREACDRPPGDRTPGPGPQHALSGEGAARGGGRGPARAPPLRPAGRGSSVTPGG